MKQVWQRLLVTAALTTGVLLLLLYLGDYVSILCRIPKGREQFGAVQVQRLLAVPQKDHKTEYIADPPQAQQCAHSLFPQLGLAPCWYLARHAIEEVDY